MTGHMARAAGLKTNSSMGNACHAVATHHDIQMVPFADSFGGCRWLGPLRYTLAGVIVFLKGRSYSAHISCVPAPQLGSASPDAQKLLWDPANTLTVSAGASVALSHFVP